MSEHTAEARVTEEAETGQPVLLAPGDGHAALLRGSKVTFKVRSDQAGGVGCAEFDAAAGFDTGLHLHSKLEEAFYVLDGEFELRAGDLARRAGPGTLMFVPPDTNAIAALRHKYDTVQLSSLSADLPALPAQAPAANYTGHNGRQLQVVPTEGYPAASGSPEAGS